MIKISKSLKSFRFAFNGILKLFRNENNARVHLLACVLVVIASICFGLTREEWLWILASIALVWITEAINTSIEKLTDLVSPGFNPKAGEVKDLAAGAVLIAAAFAVLVALIIFIPRVA